MSDTNDDRSEAIYAEVERVWRSAGLYGRRVKETPGWEVALGRVEEFCASRGINFTMGPLDADTWGHWLHILSHTLDTSGHGSSHAECELELANTAVNALKRR